MAKQEVILLYNCTTNKEVAGLEYVVDTSIIIAVLVNEEHKAMLVGLTKGANLNAPASLHWEVGNAFSAMFKRGRLDSDKAIEAVGIYERIPIRLHDVSLSASLEIAGNMGLYAYDAYFIECARKLNSPLVTLDATLQKAARQAGVDVVEV
jgi:predicted nucleic acid-binding protein